MNGSTIASRKTKDAPWTSRHDPPVGKGSDRDPLVPAKGAKPGAFPHLPRVVRGNERSLDVALLARRSSVVYSVIETTTPAPTVLPPSRMAKRCFSSIAIGVISSTSMVALSPGMIISVPAGSVHCPVTSVVRK